MIEMRWEAVPVQEFSYRPGVTIFSERYVLVLQYREDKGYWEDVPIVIKERE